MSKAMSRLACVSLAVLLTACGQQGNECIGNWKCVKYPSRSAQIERNGDSFLVKYIAPSIFKSSEVKTEVMPAVYKDGVLQLSIGGATANIGYTKASDTLLMPTAGGGSLEYHRQK